jgi:uncharacterized protein
MSEQLVIDSEQFAVNGGELSARIMLCDMPRLAGDLMSTDGNVKVVLRGEQGDDGKLFLALSLDGVLQLRCQRCLRGVVFSLSVVRRFALQPWSDDSESSSLSALIHAELTQDELEDDSLELLPASRNLNVVTLVEDEAILSLPVVPRHGDCQMPDQRHDPEAASPFGALLALKGQAGMTH